MSEAGNTDEGLLTIDELASAASTSVRTARYYASLGLLPPPERRGRLAFYDERHLAALQLVRALQEHGFSLADIQEYLERVPEGASADDLVIQRVMLTPWANARTETVTRSELDKRAGRKLTKAEVTWLTKMRAVRETDEGFELQMTFPITSQLLDLDIPRDAVLAADDLIGRHMDALSDELTELFRAQVLAPFRAQEHTDAERDRFEYSLGKLRQLTLEALVASFQRASNQAIVRALESR
ncbi:MerR family transcriptional regulator [Nocardioides sp. MH1]|uniref:MerR family transcriptional regulator n=1 Tax=Nocardioides sp. MH1 TaxID=3242490 RepID=UPI003522E898